MSPRRRKALLLALLGSVLLHLLILLGPGWHLGSLERQASVLEARLDQAPPPTPTPLSKRKPVFQPAPAPEPEAAPDPAPAPATPASGADAAPEPKNSPAPIPALAQAPAEAAAGPDAAPEAAPPLPRRGRIRFSVFTGKFLAGQSIHEWRHDGQHYQLSATSETVGLAALFNAAKVVQTSEGSFLRGELKPASFSFERGEGDVIGARFDWSARQVTLSNGQSVPIGAGAEDMLSMLYQLMQAAQRGEGFIMAVATGRKVERYAFEWLGEDALDIKAGSFHAWHVRVLNASDQGKKTADTLEVWLGREVNGLPVRIRQTDRKGGITDLVADEIDYEGKKS